MKSVVTWPPSAPPSAGIRSGAIVFAILIVILVFRPEGLLGRRAKEKV